MGLERILVLSVVFLAFSGCHSVSTEQSSLRGESYSTVLAAEAAYYYGDQVAARKTWEDEASILESSGVNLIPEGVYYDLSYLRSNLAWAHLEAGNRNEARSLFAQTFDEINEGEKQYEEYLRQRESKGQVLGSIVDVVMATHLNMSVNEWQRSNVSFADATNVIALREAQDLILDSVGGEITQGRIRYVLLPSIAPLSHTGRLLSRSACTATLVGKGLVLTNAHCVTQIGENFKYAGTEKEATYLQKDADDLQILFDDLLSRDAISAVEVYTHLGRHWDGRQETDWALIQLERHPIGRGFLGWKNISLNELPSASLFLAGFSGDLNDGRYMSIDYGCNLLSSGPKLYKTDCKSFPGSSGAALQSTLPDHRFRVVGLHAFGGEGIAGGVALNVFAEKLVELRNVTNTPGEATVDSALSSIELRSDPFALGVPECQIAGTWQGRWGANWDIHVNKSGEISGTRNYVNSVGGMRSEKVTGSYKPLTNEFDLALYRDMSPDKVTVTPTRRGDVMFLEVRPFLTKKWKETPRKIAHSICPST